MDLSRNIPKLRTAVPLFAAIGIVALLFMPSLQTLWKKWILWDQDLAHAIPTIAVMLALLARKPYESVTAKDPANTFYWLQILALTCCSLGWYFFESLSISLPAYFVLIATLSLFISTSLSRSVLWVALPYLGLLLFTIPIWSELTEILVNISSTVVGQAVKLSQVTVLLDGNSLFLPSGTIYIADGCSGIRYFIIALLMGYILILINHYPPSLAMATIFIAAALGLLANWLRIYILVLIGYHTEMQSSLMNDHETFGWVVFAFILIPAIYFSPMLKPQSTALAIPKKPRLLPLIPLAFGPVLLFISSNNALNSNPLNLDYLAQYQISESHRVGTLLHPGIPLKETKLIAVDGLQIRTDLFINTPKENREEIVPFVRGVTDGATWVLVRGIPNAHNFDIGVYKTVGNTRQIIIARQYVVGTMQTSSYLSAKFLQIIAKANGENYFGLIIAQTNCQNDCANEIAQFTTSLATISARPSAQ